MRRSEFIESISMFVVLILLSAITGCSRRSRTTDTRSTQFSSEQEKVRFLATYLQMKSDVEAAAFHIRYQDNSGGWLPGPSDWDIQAVMRVRPEDLSRWTEDMSIVGADSREGYVFDGWPNWGYSLLPDDPRWRVGSKPTVFARQDGSVMVAIFQPEGIVMKRAVKF